MLVFEALAHFRNGWGATVFDAELSRLVAIGDSAKRSFCCRSRLISRAIVACYSLRCSSLYAYW